ncbi:hypothetical protein CAPTEDRAFT_118528, partial [Capitella teleta]
VILYLVHVGAEINARDKYQCTPLHIAAMRGNEVATKELLSCPDIEVEAVDKTKMTSLHLAAIHDEKEICRMLIESGANLRCYDEDKATPLHYACAKGSIGITQMLFEAGEKKGGWDMQDKQHNSPLHRAVENRSYEVAKICIDRGTGPHLVRSI